VEAAAVDAAADAATGTALMLVSYSVTRKPGLYMLTIAIRSCPSGLHSPRPNNSAGLAASHARPPGPTDASALSSTLLASYLPASVASLAGDGPALREANMPRLAMGEQSLNLKGSDGRWLKKLSRAAQRKRVYGA